MKKPTNSNILATLLFAGLCCFGRGQDPAPAVANPVVKISEKEASTDVKAPVPIELGEVVVSKLTGRSDPNRVKHYWLVSLPAGKFKAIIDAKSGSGKKEGLGFQLAWLSLEGIAVADLGTLSDSYYRGRTVIPFELKKPLKLVLQCENLSYDGGAVSAASYWLGFFPNDEKVRTPFFATCPPIELMVVGQPVSALLEDPTAQHPDSHWRVDLPAGDYKVTVKFLPGETGKWPGTLGGAVDALSLDGFKQVSIVETHVYDSTKPDVSALGRLSFPKKTSVLIRARADFQAAAATRVIITLEKWPDN